jgi:hypothetical protein
MKILIDPTAADKIKAAHPHLRAGEWGGTDTVCMMSALVRGAEDIQDCVTAGWPEWLAELNVSMFDANVGAECEETARYQFALDVADAVQVPRDYDKARDLFLIATLDRAKKHDTDGLCQGVIGLLHRRIAGQDVAGEMTAARAAAHAARAHAAQDAADSATHAATHAAAFFAAHAAYAADSAAQDAADSATHAATHAAQDADFFAAHAARAAAAQDADFFAAHAAYAAATAANAASRQNLIAALNAA